MERLLQDIRYAARTLRRSPGFSIVAVLTLALGIGANVAIFSVVYAALLRPLPFPAPERLVTLSFEVRRPEAPGADTVPVWSYPKFETLRAAEPPFEALAGYAVFDLNLTGTGDPERLPVEVVSASYFPLLGVQALEGRTFLAEEDAAPRTHPVIALGHGLWRRRFGADPGIVGRTVEINGVPLTVVGVLPEGFHGLTGTAEAWVPMMTAPLLTYDEQLEERWSHWHRVVGRLAPGVTLARASERLPALARAVAEAHRSPYAGDEQWGIVAERLAEGRLDSGLRLAVLVLLGAVGFVLLIGCVNVAGLMLARSSARRREVAIRIAIGAGRGRLVRQLLTESAVLALAGGAAGLLLGVWATDALTALAPTIAGAERISPLIDLRSAGLDLPVLAFTLVVSLLTGVLFGLVPAVQASRPAVVGALKDSGDAVGRAARRDPRGLLVAVETALALVLLVGAGLLLRSFAELRGVPIGFEPDHVLTFRLDPAQSQVDIARAPAFYAELLERVTALPGVEAAGINRCAPLTSRCMGSVVTQLDNTSFAAPDWGPAVGVHPVSTDYFRTLRIPLLRGRAFDERDRRGAPLVAVVNETAARTLWPGQDPIGQRIDIGTYQGKEVIPGVDDPPREIVGVVGDVRALGLDRTPTETMYIPRAQAPDASGVGSLGAIAVRARAGAGLETAVLDAIRALEPRMPMPRFRKMPEVIGASVAHERFDTVLLGTFAGLALVLTAIGVYGIVAYTVRQRTGEIGVRMALGARRDDVVRLVVRQGMTPVAIGLGIGIIAALALTRLIAGLLYGVSPMDPVTLVAVSVALTVVAGLATYLPARRAAGVDPMVVLRVE